MQQPLRQVLFVALLVPSCIFAGTLEIHHLDVGEGDATLIIGPDGTTVLVDAGPDGYFGRPDGGELVFLYLESIGVTSLDYTILTHRDADHAGGFGFGVYNTFPTSVLLADWESTLLTSRPGLAGVDDDGNSSVDFSGDDGCGTEAIEVPDAAELGYAGLDHYLPTTAYDNGEEATSSYCSLSKTYRRYVQTVEAAGIRNPLGDYASLMTAYTNPIALGDGATATIVASSGWIATNATRISGSDGSSSAAVNARSLGLYVEYKEFDYLVAGDLTGNEGPQVEQALAAFLATIADSPTNDPVDVLRLDHHGSNTSSAQAFLDTLQPEAAVLSCGDENTYGHPEQEVIDRIAAMPTPPCVYATEEGTPRNWTGLYHQVLNSAVIVTTDGLTYEITNGQGTTDTYTTDGLVFADDFETGDTSKWSVTVGGT